MSQRVVLMVAACGLATAALAPAARAQTTRELSRSAPIVATVAGVEAQYQGSFEVVTPAPAVPTYNGAADAATFVFPHTTGHLRAVDTADIAGTTTAFQDLPALFDAATAIPAPTLTGCTTHFTAACRTVFTTIEAPDAAGLAAAPDRVFVNTSNVTQLRPLLAPALADPDVIILIERILAGRPDGLGGFLPGLGGIDRSTLAVIEHSPFTPVLPGGDRPTMIYVGGLDGMIHAICAEVLGDCTTLGQELWAFIPRTQLGALRLNTQRIDGTVKVADVFDDFPPIDGVREFRTVLTFQTGSGDPAVANLQPSIIAIDVSNPSDPIVLWERSTPATRSSVDLGVGLTLAMGPARVAGVNRNLVFAQTNNGGTSATSGFYIGAYDAATGDRPWFFRATYPAPRNGANPAVPDTGIPGGIAAFDREQAGLVTHIAFSTLYGDLWVMEADGDRPYGSAPIFRFSTDFHPIGAAPTLYSDLATAQLYGVVVSGGYVDPVAATWVQPTDDQFVVSVALDPQSTPLPIDEVGASVDLALNINIGPGRRTTAQAIIAGNELFVTTDSTDANLLTYGEVPDTGSLSRFSLETGLQVGSSVTVAGGAASTDVTAAGMVHVGGGAGAMKVDATATGGGAFDATGAGVERSPVNNNQRLLWMNE